MPRPARMLEEGRIYHVYNRVGGEEMPFEDDDLASRFVELLRKVVERDEMVVYAWVLMGNHFHQVVRMGAAPLSRSMKTLQQEVTRARNLKAKIYGPLWQGRFKAKRVVDEGYLSQLIAYVHLNPVKAGLVDEIGRYRWSGHRDVLGLRRHPIVSVDDVLIVYGGSRRVALRRYRSALREVGEAEWANSSPGRLPWWRLGRPPASDDLHPIGGESADELGRPTSPFRSRYEADDWIDTACRRLGIDRDELASRSRRPGIVRARDIVGLLGVERYGVKVKDLAERLGKSEDGVSLWVRRGGRRREQDAAFAAEVEVLDASLKEER